MKYWLTENAFQPMMIGLLLVFVAWTFWFISRKRELMITAIAVGVSTFGIVVIETFVVTDAEQLRKDVASVAAAVQSNDVDATLSFISPGAQIMIDDAKREMREINFKKLSVKRFNEPKIDLDSIPPKANISFNAIVLADCSQSNRYGNVARVNGAARVTLFYEKNSDGDWKLVDYDYKRVTANDFMGSIDD